MKPFEDPEFQRAASEKGTARFQELQKLKRDDPEAYMQTKFAREKPRLAQNLLDAAYGKGEWEGLDPAKRLQALMKALEYALGKPSAGKAVNEVDQPQGDEPGIELV